MTTKRKTTTPKKTATPPAPARPVRHRALYKLAPFSDEEQEMLVNATSEKDAIWQVESHRYFMALPIEDRLKAGYLTKQERQLINAWRLLDAWFDGLAADERQQFRSQPRAEQLETLKRVRTGQPVNALLDRN